MKRRITIEQIQELTDGQIQKLRGLWEPQYGDLILFYDTALRRYHNESIVYSYDPYNGRIRDVTSRILEKRVCLPLFNIGQMFELLESQKHQYGVRKLQQIYSNKYQYYEYLDTPEKQFYKPYDELCDVLWEAVKKLL